MAKAKIDIGITKASRKQIADGLSRLLADSYTLYVKTHGFHWNVTGPMFNTLHLMFETQYTELALAVDLIAERIRALDFPAPGSSAQFAKLSSIPEEAKVPRLEGHGDPARRRPGSRRAHRAFALPHRRTRQRPAHPRPLTQRMQVHEKNAWMLRSLLA
jgi:starvation-inducible DNA-binding protein